ncbi:TonB-dependent receptor [Acinetobacter sp. NCu2D-2]|uniref:TonB-dependent receptor plug domain-containing protein n=1 Tax=Acinetobacter sp. NCu2D-2 TaxID=1608473 RepID=UPI0007CDD95A|nr:TonB-dependent receptor [Acinetobacter sp. NCu2D-2]ANF80904.1 TonB-dependent receptor [Acinetobacter sp. NCu2D-2]
MKSRLPEFKFNALMLSLLAISATVSASDPVTTAASSNSEPSPTTVQTLPTITYVAEEATAKDPDISAIPKAVISREEMEQYGDQSVKDALRRAAGIQMGGLGSGPRGGNGAMRFRGGGAPVFLINGEPVQGGPRGGMSVVDSITPDMIERIEIVKQPSVAQASVASSAVINIILKEPLDDTLISGTVRAGYGFAESAQKEEERKNLSLQMDGRRDALIYSLSVNQMWNDSTNVIKSQKNGEDAKQNKRITERKSLMISPRMEYELDDQQKLIAEVFYRNNQSDGQSGRQIQDDKNDSIRLNTRYERKDQGNSDKIRLSAEHQNETEKTRLVTGTNIIDQTINEYGLAYDGVRKFDDKKQIKFGVDSRASELESNIESTLDEQRYAMYVEGSMRVTDRNTLTLGVRQEWLKRSGLVEYSDQHFSPVLAHRFDFDEHWSLQTNLSQAFRSPRADSLMPTISVSNDEDAGSLSNPDRGGNPNLKPEKISAIESTLGYNTPAGGVNLTAYHRKIDDYIERVIRQEGDRYIETPSNQDNATTYGVELAGRYALKQTENGHSFMLNAQVSTVRAKVEEANGQERLVSDVAPYSASAGVSYNYQPWRLSTSLNANYTPAYSRVLDQEPYRRSNNQRINVDISATKRFDNDWAASFNARNIFSTDYKTRLTDLTSGELHEARSYESIPSFMLSLEKKF